MSPHPLLCKEDKLAQKEMWLFLAVLTLVTCFPTVHTRIPPSFQDLKSHYAGDPRYGGLYDKEALLRLTNLTNSFGDVTDTCPLRMSLALNHFPLHAIYEARLKSFDRPSDYITAASNYSYFKGNYGIIKWLNHVYGEPFVADNAQAYLGRQGIMYLNETGDGESCRVLLWDGVGFHQAWSFIHHKNVKEFYLWETPTSGCSIDINLKQSTCFPGKSSVELFTGEKIPMKSLKIGDRVKTFTADGKIVYSPVMTFLDQMPDYGGYYHTIITESQTSVTLSRAHLIFRKELSRGLKGSLGFHTARALYASQLRPDDVIYVLCPRTGAIVSQRVLAVSLAEEKGAYAPVTEEGTLLVDGVWVSCYADLGDHQLAHYLMSPLKSLYGLAPWVLGAGGGYVHGYLKGALRPIGMKLFGEDKFYKEP